MSVLFGSPEIPKSTLLRRIGADRPNLLLSAHQEHVQLPPLVGAVGSVHARGPEALFAGKDSVIDGIFEKLKALQPDPIANVG